MHKYDVEEKLLIFFKSFLQIKKFLKSEKCDMHTHCACFNLKEKKNFNKKYNQPQNSSVEKMKRL